jgi:phospholipase C
MTSSSEIAAHIQDTSSFFSDVTANTLPAVSIIKPDGFVDGHPASSKTDLFEGFVDDIVTAVQANSTLWANTAIFITFDESGGFYDSGYIQPLDFFGDGPRIPLIVVSPYSTGGIVNHSYADHVSLDKFIERNWGLGKISTRSRDNFPIRRSEAIHTFPPIARHSTIFSTASTFRASRWRRIQPRSRLLLATAGPPPSPAPLAAVSTARWR